MSQRPMPATLPEPEYFDDEAHFANAAIPPGLREQAINLGSSGGQAMLLALGDTLCLLTVRP